MKGVCVKFAKTTQMCHFCEGRDLWNGTKFSILLFKINYLQNLQIVCAKSVPRMCQDCAKVSPYRHHQRVNRVAGHRTDFGGATAWDCYDCDQFLGIECGIAK